MKYTTLLIINHNAKLTKACFSYNVGAKRWTIDIRFRKTTGQDIWEEITYFLDISCFFRFIALKIWKLDGYR